MRLTFDPVAHVYRVDGQVVPLSMTQVIRAAGMSPSYDGVPEHVLKQAADRGIHVDLACDLLDEDDLDWQSVVPRWSGYVKGWQHGKDKYQIETLRTQVMLYHPILHVAGTIDVWALERHCGNGGRIDIDRKTTRDAHPSSWGLQLGGYGTPGMLVARPDGELVSCDPPVVRWIFQLTARGGVVRHVCADPEDVADFAACVRVARSEHTDADTDRLAARVRRYAA